MPEVTEKQKYQRYLVVKLDALAGFAPDWVSMVLELARQCKIRGLKPGDSIALRANVWQAAGIVDKARRKKVLAHLQNKVSNDLIEVCRHRGKVATVTIGAELSSLNR